MSSPQAAATDQSQAALGGADIYGMETDIAIPELHPRDTTGDTVPNAEDTATPSASAAGPSQSSSVWAFRRAGNIRNALFFKYDDCKHLLGGDEISNDDLEFEMFQHVTDAMVYLQMEESSSGSSGCATSALTTNSTIAAKSMSMTSSNKQSKTTLLPFKTRDRIKAANNPKRRPTKAWDKMFDALKEYALKYGTTEVDDSNREHEALFKWKKQQDVEYKNLLDGKGSSMFRAKIDLLESIGYKFTYISVEDKYAMLLKFKQEKGHYNVPITYPVLGKWMEKQRNIARKLIRNDATSYFDMKFKEFAALGVTIGISIQSEVPMTTEESLEKDHDENWEKYYDRMVEHKRECGTLDMSRQGKEGDEKDDLDTLQEWVQRQHQEYQKIQDRKSSKLTLARVQKLTDLGFIFQQRKQSVKWEDRIKQLKRFKQKFGHVRVPKSNPELGVFVNRQRYEYSKLSQGKPSSLTPTRLEDLTQVGFVFVAGKTPKQSEKKPWEARYQELLQYKEEHGHCMVAQKAGLGEWVHSQRLYYRKLKQGKKSPLTPERLLMLANMGFVFDASKRRGKPSSNIDQQQQFSSLGVSETQQNNAGFHPGHINQIMNAQIAGGNPSPGAHHLNNRLSAPTAHLLGHIGGPMHSQVPMMDQYKPSQPHELNQMFLETARHDTTNEPNIGVNV